MARTLFLRGRCVVCWKEGEERITHDHGWHDGFARTSRNNKR
ncbi:DUF2203 family protein [Paenibacillus spongiae]